MFLLGVLRGVQMKFTNGEIETVRVSDDSSGIYNLRTCIVGWADSLVTRGEMQRAGGSLGFDVGSNISELCQNAIDISLQNRFH